jgi:hypothetical protein
VTSGLRYQPCRSRQYATRPPNPIALRLREVLPRVFCDLHDARQIDQLHESSGLDGRQLLNALFVTERYEPSDWPLSDFPINSTYPEFQPGAGVLHLDAAATEWEVTVPPPEVLAAGLNATDTWLATLILSGNHQRLIALVGRVGCGKTSLLSRFLDQVKPQIRELDNYVFLRLDFSEQDVAKAWFDRTRGTSPFDAALNVALSGHFASLPEPQPGLDEIFAHAYVLHGKKFEYGRYSATKQDAKATKWYVTCQHNPSTWNDARMHYLQDNLKKNVLIVVDNVDTWELAEQIALAKHLFKRGVLYGATLFLVLRHNAYVEFQKTMPTSQSRVHFLYLTPPLLDQVATRRLQLLAAVDPEGVWLRDRHLVGTDDAPFADVAEFVDFLTKSSQSITTGPAGDFVKNFCNHNVRRMLDFVALVVSSHQTPLSRFLPSAGPSPSSHVPLHRVIAVAALRDGPFYRPDVSEMCNLFCNGSASAHCDSLVRFRVLGYVAQADVTPQATLWKLLSAVGYETEQVRAAIAGLATAGLIETRQRLADPEALLFPTAAGRYYIDTLARNISYYQFMRDGAYLPGNLSPTGNHDKREIRLLGAARFVEFLDSEEQEEERRGVQREPTAYRSVCGNGLSIASIASNDLLAQLRTIPVEGGPDADVTRGESIRIITDVAERARPGRVG